MPKAIRCLIVISCLVWGCASQQGVIDRPDWAQQQVSWAGSGLTIASFGQAEYQLSAKEDARQAEEQAMKKARQMLASEIAKAYLKASGSSISEGDATHMALSALGNLIETRSKYDEQRRVYFIQIFVPSSRIDTILQNAYGQVVPLNGAKPAS